MPRGASRARRRPGAPLAVALSLFLCALAAPATAAPAAACPGANSSPNGRNAKLIDGATLCLMNQVRRAHQLAPLRFNAALGRIASGQAADMVRGHYFGDQSLSGQSPMARIMASHYVSHAARVRLHAAQNIGWGMGHAATPEGIVQAWMESPPHRAIILTGSYRDAGVGVAPSLPTGFNAQYHLGTYAAEFGTRAQR